MGGIVGVLVVLGLAATVLVRRRSHDDVHSVEHYHRQLHTLEEMRTHLPVSSHLNGDDEASFPASAIRVSGSSAVRLTEPGRPVVPPAPPPPVANPGEPLTFEDVGTEVAHPTFMSGSEDPVIGSINHRPRRLAGPAAAVAAVIALVVVLIVTGMHTSSPPRHGKAAATTATAPPTHHHAARHEATTTSTTLPIVSAPQAGTGHAATYQVAAPTYALSLSATTGECWVMATDTATGSVLFTATLFMGQSHTVAATGPVTVIAGAPAAFSATVNGAAVSLPAGYQAPFTLRFQTPSTA